MSCNWLDGAFTFLLVWDANIFSRQMQIEDFAKKKNVGSECKIQQREKWNNEKITVCNCRSLCFQAQKKQTNKTQTSNMVNPLQIKKMNE